MPGKRHDHGRLGHLDVRGSLSSRPTRSRSWACCSLYYMADGESSQVDGAVDPVSELRNAARAWRRYQARGVTVEGRLRLAVLAAIASGVPEAQVAALARRDRGVIRRWQGK